MSRFILIGCGKSKKPGRHAAADLYTGNLFAARRRYAELAEAREDSPPWWIVSAEYGLLSPSTEIAGYDLTIRDLDPLDRAAWGLAVVAGILSELDDGTTPRGVVLELHLGADYVEPIRDVAIAVGLKVDWPVQGMGIGEQLFWYKGVMPSRGAPR